MASRVKNPAEMSVEDKLKNLYALQKVLSRIDALRTIRGELPEEVEDLADEVEGLQLRIQKLKEDADNVRLTIAKFKEGKVQAQMLIERAQKHLEDVSNSREYDGLTKEIEYQNLEIQLCDKRIAENTNRESEINAKIEITTSKVEEQQRELELKKKELDEIIEETKIDEDRLREETLGLEAKIEPRLLSAFKRIRKNVRNGMGIVVVERDSCGGCFAKIPPQRQLDVVFHKKVIVCEYCGRVLVDPELAGIKAKKVVEEPKKRRLSSRSRKEKTE